MSKVLYITANPKPEEESFSLGTGRKFIDIYKQNNPDDEIKEIDLYKVDIPFIDNDILNGWDKLGNGKGFEELTESEKVKISNLNKYTDQFIEADKYVFVTPMWNLSIPPLMKAYIDTIVITKKTFKYTETGPVGLLKDKKAVHIQACGGTYSSGPAKDFEFGNSYIRSILTFIGVTSIDTILIEGTSIIGADIEAIKKDAVEKIEEVIKNF